MRLARLPGVVIPPTTATDSYHHRRAKRWRLPVGTRWKRAALSAFRQPEEDILHRPHVLRTPHPFAVRIIGFRTPFADTPAVNRNGGEGRRILRTPEISACDSAPLVRYLPLPGARPQAPIGCSNPKPIVQAAGAGHQFKFPRARIGAPKQRLVRPQRLCTSILQVGLPMP